MKHLEMCAFTVCESLFVCGGADLLAAVTVGDAFYTKSKLMSAVFELLLRGCFIQSDKKGRKIEN